MSDQKEPKFIPLEIASCDEPWTTVKLACGATVRVRLNITDCSLIADPDTGQVIDNAGKPAIQINWQSVYHVIDKNGVIPTATVPHGRKN